MTLQELCKLINTSVELIPWDNGWRVKIAHAEYRVGEGMLEILSGYGVDANTALSSLCSKISNRKLILWAADKKRRLELDLGKIQLSNKYDYVEDDWCWG